MARDREIAREPEREKGFIGSVFSLVCALLGAAITAVAASVIVEWVGIAMEWWPGDHSAQMLYTERSYIEAIEAYPLTPLRPVDISDKALASVDGAVSSAGITTGVYLAAMLNTIKLVILRSVLSLFALPGYLLVALAAFFEGLVARDIRKYTGGHESSYVFHKAKRWITPTVVLTVTIYLMLPFSVAPALVFAPTMFFTGVMVYIATSRFKKFV